MAPPSPAVREAGPADLRGIVDLNDAVFGPREAAAVRHLLDAEGHGPGRWSVAVGPDGDVVACAVLLEHTLRYGATPVPVAQVEFVATAETARRAGLARAQFDLHHRWADEAGALLTLVTGIPYLYRRLGYGYGFDYADLRHLVTVPRAPEHVEVRPATEDDRPAIAALHRARQDHHDIAALVDEAAWGWLLRGAPTWDEQVLVAVTDGEVVGTVRLQPHPEDGRAEAGGTATTVPAAEALVAACARRASGATLFLLAHEGDPWDVVARRCGDRDPARFNAVYARVPDLAALLDHLRPELSHRLAASSLATASGELRLGAYDQGAIVRYDRGVVTAVDPDPEPLLDPLDDDLPGVPPDHLGALVLGRWGASELETRIDDVGYVADRDLMAVLFPRQRILFDPPI